MSFDINDVKSVIKSHGRKEYNHQIEFLMDPEVLSTDKPNVYAAGVSAGKTLVTVMLLELCHRNPENKGRVSVVCPSNNIILRNNFFTEIKNSKLSSRVITKGTRDNPVRQQLKQAIEDGVEVIIVLPQTINKSIPFLPKNILWFVYDEAHNGYFSPMVQNLLKRTTPRHQLLLTGTPSKFNAKSDDFYITYVSVMELYDAGLVSNVRMEIVSSSYGFHKHDYRYSGELKKGKTANRKKAADALTSVLVEMLKKLKTRLKLPRSISIGNLTNNLVGNLFKYLDKTIIFTHSIEQAETFENMLVELLGRDAVVRSDSESDTDSLKFDSFKLNETIRVLIAVDRGKLGWSMREMFNVVDFTLTQNLDMLMQMYGRLLRLSSNNPDKQKVYYKVAPNTMADYFRELMTGMLALTHREWYTKYDGKNLDHITIPTAIRKTPNKKKKGSGGRGGRRPGVPTPYIPLDIPMDLDLWKTAMHDSNGKFHTIAWTTLGDVKRILLDFERDRKTIFPEEQMEKIINTILPSTDGYNSVGEWKKDYEKYHSWCKRNDGIDTLYAHTGWHNRYGGRTIDDVITFCKNGSYTCFNELNKCKEGKKYYGWIYKENKNSNQNLWQHIADKLDWELSGHMKYSWKTFDEIYNVAKNCKDEKEFRTLYSGARQTAQRRKMKGTNKKEMQVIRTMLGWETPKSGPPKGVPVGPFSKKHRENISKAMKGRIPWNKK